MVETTVTSVRGRQPRSIHTDPNLVYVGRSCRGWAHSAWHNPFKIVGGQLDVGPAAEAWWRENEARIEDLGRSVPITAVTLHREWLVTRDDLLARIPGLFGKRLACWCGEWQPGARDLGCHAVTLATLANAWLDLLDARFGDLVDAWHESKGGGPLREAVGLGQKQYAAMVEGRGYPAGYRPPGWAGDAEVLRGVLRGMGEVAV